MSHPSAQALLRRIVADPGDVVARLVFADWLDETGALGNAAWARYIRARAEEGPAGLPPAAEQGVVADLTLPAATFVPNFPAFLDLLPSSNYTVQLPPKPIPARVLGPVTARFAVEHQGLPLGSRANRTLVGMLAPRDRTAVAAFAGLYWDVVPVRVLGTELAAVVNATFPRVEVAWFAAGR